MRLPSSVKASRFSLLGDVPSRYSTQCYAFFPKTWTPKIASKRLVMSSRLGWPNFVDNLIMKVTCQSSMEKSLQEQDGGMERVSPVQLAFLKTLMA